MPIASAKGIVDSASGLVGVGVHGEERTTGPHEACQRASAARGLSDAGHAVQQKRMVGDQQLDLSRGGVGDYLWSCIHSEHDAMNSLSRVAGHEPDAVPLLGGTGVGPAVQQGQDL